jgi:hypothetical protein
MQFKAFFSLMALVGLFLFAGSVTLSTKGKEGRIDSEKKCCERNRPCKETPKKMDSNPTESIIWESFSDHLLSSI